MTGLTSMLPLRSGVARRPDTARSASRSGGASIALRSPEEIERIAAAGAVVRAALDAARAACVVGATTAEIDEAASTVIRACGGTPLFLGYPSPHGGEPFPAVTCISVEDEVVHGVPGRRRVAAGELVSIDCGVSLDGWCADAAVTVFTGPGDAPLADARRRGLLSSAEAMLALAIREARPGRRWSEIAAAMQAIPVAAGHGVLLEYVGHGIGRDLHESPEVPNCLSANFIAKGDFTLRPGMVLAVEPMLTLRGPAGADPVDDGGFPRGVATRRLDDGWTVVAADGSPAAHVEHTIAITRGGCRVLTRSALPASTTCNPIQESSRLG